MREYEIVCIDDDEQFLDSLESVLPQRVTGLCEEFKCTFDFVTTPEELMEVLAAGADGGHVPAMLISDQLMPRMTGIDLIEKVKAEYPELVCILLTGHAGLDSAKYAINRHLLDQYVSKPIEDMQEFASIVANLLKRQHLDREERQRTAELAATAEALRRSNEHIRNMHAAAEQVALLAKGLKSLDFDEVVQLAVQEVPRIFHADFAVLCFPENGCPAQEATLLRRNNCPAPDCSVAARREAEEAGETGAVFVGPVPRVCENLGGRSPSVLIPLNVPCFHDDDTGRAPDRRGYLCLCALAGGAACGEAIVQYKGELVRDVLGANLANAALYQQARRRSQVDVLTGVATRRVLEEKLAAEGERAMRYGRGFCVAIADVDNFKSVNDNFGHHAGDQVLRQVAGIMREEVRTADSLARYGGDEFGWLMPETELADAVAAAERVRRRVASSCSMGGQPVTISCGVAAWTHLPGDTPACVLRRADAALYQAKRAGRNRVEVAEEAGCAPTASDAGPNTEQA